MYELNGYVYGGRPIGAIKITEAKALSDMIMILTFDSGEKRVFDATILSGPVFAPLKNEKIFLNFKIEYGVITWNNGKIDCSPEYMYDHSFEYAHTA